MVNVSFAVVRHFQWSGGQVSKLLLSSAVVVGVQERLGTSYPWPLYPTEAQYVLAAFRAQSRLKSFSDMVLNDGLRLYLSPSAQITLGSESTGSNSPRVYGNGGG